MKLLNGTRLEAAVDSRVKSDLDACIISGASVCVMQQGETILKKHYGTVSPDLGTPMHDGSIYRLASMTKPITAAAVMILSDRGLLSVDDEVGKYLPDFASMSVLASPDAPDGKVYPLGRSITVKELLTHTSGFGSGKVATDLANRATSGVLSNFASYIDFIKGSPLAFVPGTQQMYSPTAGFALLSAVVEQVSGMPFPDFLAREIFVPCEMKDATFDPTDEQWTRMVGMHTRVDGKSAVGTMHPGCVYRNYSTKCYLGGSCLASTMADYVHFAEMLRCGGVYGGSRVLSEAAVRELSKPQISETVMPGFQRWGYGVRVIASCASATLPVGAYGWSGACGTHFWVDPANQITAVYMKNSEYDGGSGAVTAYRFEQAVYNTLKG